MSAVKEISLSPALSSKNPAPSSKHCEPSKTKQDASRAKSENTSFISHGKLNLSSPIGYIRSCFKSKNGTPRQPSVCSYSRAKLRILKSAFVCPDHSLDGLAAFSHVWILFVFHQNGQENFTKAKVKPPRLDGKKVGVFASRSPHRPNPIGLTLARLDKVEGDTVHLSGMDMIEGTPVLDIKPYVPEYDCPVQTSGLLPSRLESSSASSTKRNMIPELGDTSENIGIYASRIDGLDSNLDLTTEYCNADQSLSTHKKDGELHCNISPICRESKAESSDSNITSSTDMHHQIHQAGGQFSTASKSDGKSLVDRGAVSQETLEQAVSSHSNDGRTGSDLGHCSTVDESMDNERTPSNEMEGMKGLDVTTGGVRVAEWVSSPPIRRLSVRFTPSAESQLAAFWQEENKDSADHKQEFLQDKEEAHCAIEDILLADPRSVYRRNDCSDRLYFFMIDNLHITSWFGPGFAEVLNIQPISHANIPVNSKQEHQSKTKAKT